LKWENRQKRDDMMIEGEAFLIDLKLGKEEKEHKGA
jgi:hypothetical protein